MKVVVIYFAGLKEQRGCAEETVATDCRTPEELYADLRHRHGLALPWEALSVAVNDEFRGGDCPLNDQDTVAYLPPVAGG